MRKAFGDQQVEQVAQEAGISTEEASNQLAAILPATVDQLTPNGQMPTSEQARSALGGFNI